MNIRRYSSWILWVAIGLVTPTLAGCPDGNMPPPDGGNPEPEPMPDPMPEPEPEPEPEPQPDCTDVDSASPQTQIPSDYGNAALIVPAGAATGPVCLSVKRASYADYTAIPEGYTLTEPYVYKFEPYATTFGADVTVRLPYQGQGEGLYLYKLDNGDDITWERKDTAVITGGYADYTTTSLGIFVVLRQDPEPPPPEGIEVSGQVYDWGYIAAYPQNDVTVRVTNIQPPAASDPSAGVGNYAFADPLPPGSTLYMSSTYEQTVQVGLNTITVPAQSVGTTRRNAYTENVSPLTVNTYVAKLSWLAQVAYECGVFASFDAAVTADGTNINPFWIGRSTIVGSVVDVNGTGVPNVPKEDIRVEINGYENYHGNAGDLDNYPAYLCWLDEGLENKYVGTGSATSYASGRFVMFRVRNDIGVGQGTAYVRADGFYETSVSLNSSGQTGYVKLEAGDEIIFEPDAIEFGVTVYPLFAQYGCVGCHYNGGPGDYNRNGYYARFDGTEPAADVADQDPNRLPFEHTWYALTGPGTQCDYPTTTYRVCVNDPGNSYVYSKPRIEEPPNHPNGSWLETDYELLNIYAWIQQGAAKYLVPPEPPPPVVTSYDMMNYYANVGCITCHDKAGYDGVLDVPAGGLALNGCRADYVAGGQYVGWGVDPDPATNPDYYNQDCVWAQLRAQGVDDDPYAYGYRVYPGVDNADKSMLLRNPYCGPDYCAADPDYPEAHPVRIFYNKEAAPYTYFYQWIYDGAYNDYPGAEGVDHHVP